MRRVWAVRDGHGSDKLLLMKPTTVEVWVWVLIYGGLFAVAVGVFVLRGGARALGWTLLALGVLATLAGAALVALRARMAPPETPPQRPGP